MNQYLKITLPYQEFNRDICRIANDIYNQYDCEPTSPNLSIIRTSIIEYLTDIEMLQSRIDDEDAHAELAKYFNKLTITQITEDELSQEDSSSSIFMPLFYSTTGCFIK